MYTLDGGEDYVRDVVRDVGEFAEVNSPPSLASVRVRAGLHRNTVWDVLRNRSQSVHPVLRLSSISGGALCCVLEHGYVVRNWNRQALS